MPDRDQENSSQNEPKKSGRQRGLTGKDRGTEVKGNEEVAPAALQPIFSDQTKIIVSGLAADTQPDDLEDAFRCIVGFHVVARSLDGCRFPCLSSCASSAHTLR